MAEIAISVKVDLGEAVSSAGIDSLANAQAKRSDGTLTSVQPACAVLRVDDGGEGNYPLSNNEEVNTQSSGKKSVSVTKGDIARYVLLRHASVARQSTSSSSILRTSQESEEKMKESRFLTIPLEIRRAILGYFFPVGQNLQITGGPPEWNTLLPRRKPFLMTRDARSLLLACGQLNDEATRLLYGTNTFLLAPGSSNAVGRKIVPCIHRWSLFLSRIRPSTKQVVKMVHLCLGSSLRWGIVKRLAERVAGFSKMVITVEPTHLLSYDRRLTQQAYLRKSCRTIAAARRGVPSNGTIWDDCGDAATERLLREIMPNGYSSVA